MPGGFKMSLCKECSEHPSGFLKCCDHACEQVTNNDGEVVSKYLACPHFKTNRNMQVYEGIVAARVAMSKDTMEHSNKFELGEPVLHEYR